MPEEILKVCVECESEYTVTIHYSELESPLYCPMCGESVDDVRQDD